MSKYSKAWAITALTVAFSSSNGYAAGFYLAEVGTPGSLGTGGVANVTNNKGLDASWTNPAGLTDIEGGYNVMSGLQVVIPRIKFDVKHMESRGLVPVGGDNGGNAGIATAIPSLFVVGPAIGKARFGMSVTAPLGGGLDYGDGFAGRYAVKKTQLGGIAFTPSVGYRLTDKLSVGAGASVIYTALTQEIAIRQSAALPDAQVKFDKIDDWGVQGILGLNYEVSDRLFLGLVYRSKMDTKLEGDVRVNNLQLPIPIPKQVGIDWTNPQWLEAGARFRVSDKTMVFVNGGWQQWSKFSDNEIAFDDGVKVLDRNWQDTWHAGIAVLHQLEGGSHFSLGLVHESSPVKDQDRTFDLPMDEIWKFSAGYFWQPRDNLGLSIGATLYRMGNASVDQTAQGVRVKGDFSSNTFAMVGGSLRYDF